MQTWEKKTLTTSFVVTSTLGASFVVWYWSTAGATTIGGARAALFVMLVAVLHLVAAKLYRNQPQAARSRAPGFNKPRPEPIAPAAIQLSISPLYVSAIRFSSVQVLGLLVLSALLLDGGEANRVVLVATLAHLIIILLCAGLRPTSPSRFDLAMIRYGFIPLTFTIGSVANWVRHIL